MCALFAPVVLSLVAAPPAQWVEKVHEVGKDGLTLAGRIEAGDTKVKVLVDDRTTLELPARRYRVSLTAGKSYRLTLASKEIDSYLVVQDGSGQQVDFDDDSGGGLG